MFARGFEVSFNYKMHAINYPSIELGTSLKNNRTFFCTNESLLKVLKHILMTECMLCSFHQLN